MLDVPAVNGVGDIAGDPDIQVIDVVNLCLVVLYVF